MSAAAENREMPLSTEDSPGDSATSLTDSFEDMPADSPNTAVTDISAQAENHEISSTDSDEDMYEELEKHQMPFTVREIISISKPIFTRIGIPNVYLFGSYAGGFATRKSNIEFAIWVGVDKRFNMSDMGKIGEAKEKLEDAFRKEVDLVVPLDDFLALIQDYMIPISTSDEDMISTCSKHVIFLSDLKIICH